MPHFFRPLSGLALALLLTVPLASPAQQGGGDFSPTYPATVRTGPATGKALRPAPSRADPSAPRWALTRQLRHSQRLAGGLLALVLGGGALLGWTLYSRRRLQAALAALRQANDSQRELLRVIGHDLRGPVALFQQITPLLREAVGPGASAEAAELTQELDISAQQLGGLVDNLLDWARLQNDLLSCVPGPLRAAVAVQGAGQLYEPVARHKGIALTADAPSDLVVWADLNLLLAVLRNLLANAVKFNPAGGAVRVAATATAGGVCFSVADTGPGLPPDALATMLRGGTVASRPGTAGETGSGLGLPLCRHFVALLGGALYAEANAAGPGLRFWFVLPAEPPVATLRLAS